MIYMLGVYLVMTLGFIFFLSPLITLFTHISLLILTVPLSVYGLLTMAAAYTAREKSKWLPIAVIIGFLGLFLTLGVFGGGILNKKGFEVGGIISIVSLVVMIFMDFSLFATVTKMEVFNYMEDN